MKKDKFYRVEQQALRSGDEFWLDTIHFFRNANEIYARYEDWKDIDKFYFIPLKLDMSYHINGMQICMADSPVYLGTFIRNTFKHKDLFTTQCPKCGRTLYPYGYNGSPLSGRVDLEATCSCGWDDFVIVKGWRIRSEALKATQKEDKGRLLRARLFHPGFREETIQSLMEFLHG